MTTATTDARADALLASYRAGRLCAGRARRSCSRPSRSSTCPARTSASSMYPDHRPARARNCACGPTSPFRWRATISPRPRPAQPPGFCYLGPVFRHRGERRRRIPAGRHRILRPRRTRPRPTPKCWRSGWRRPPHSASTAPEIRTGDVALFAALIDALDLAPVWRRRLIKDFNRKATLAQDLERLTLERRQRPAGISGRAGGARRLRPQGGARAGHRPAVDRRHHHRRRPLGRRDRRPLPRTVDARRRRRAAARHARADRALPRDRAAIPTRPRRDCARSPPTPGSTLDAALDQFESRIGFMAARGIDVDAHPLLHRVRPRPRLLHRLRVRTARPGAPAPSRWSPAAATTGC